MNLSVNGCVVDETTGEPLTSPDVRLYRIGVSGETCTVLNEHGCFSFSDLPEGEYSLAFYDKNFVPRYERLTRNAFLGVLQGVAITRNLAFILFISNEICGNRRRRFLQWNARNGGTKCHQNCQWISGVRAGQISIRSPLYRFGLTRVDVHITIRKARQALFSSVFGPLMLWPVGHKQIFLR
jgi:hypothetical protein